MKRCFLLTLTAFLCLMTSMSAQDEEQDSLKLLPDEMVTGFPENLDSLLNLWYVEQFIQFNQPDSFYTVDTDIELPDYPDSVYIERIRKIPTIIDLSYNRIVRNFIDLYAKERRERVSIMLTLSEYYFPLFEEIFDRYGIPPELKYMAVIESALNPRAVSRVGATGIWQFMYSTGRSYDLTVNSLVDERRDPYRSTLAAAEFLSDLHRIYNDWILVIAAYNCGPGNVNKAIRRSGGKRNYWDLYYYLPRETRGYVPAFIAASYIMNYYEYHHLQPVPVDLQLNSDTLIIRDKLHLKQVAEVLSIPVKQLRDLNPQFKHDIIPGDSKNYLLRIPQAEAIRFIDLEDSIFAYKDSIFFNPEKMIVNPTARTYHVPQLSSDKYDKYIYTVRPGDNLGFISMWYNVRLSDIRYWNNIRSNMIRVGQKIVVYKPKGSAGKYASINEMSFAAKQAMIGKSTVTQEKIEAVVQDGTFVYHKVRYGDTLWEIAKQYPGVSDSDIARLNNMNYGETIKPGQVLKIKRKI